jgi:hypothetical protein
MDMIGVTLVLWLGLDYLLDMELKFKLDMVKG